MLTTRLVISSYIQRFVCIKFTISNRITTNQNIESIFGHKVNKLTTSVHMTYLNEIDRHLSVDKDVDF